jgi:hypothetical protein
MEMGGTVSDLLSGLSAADPAPGTGRTIRLGTTPVGAVRV